MRGSYDFSKAVRNPYSDKFLREEQMETRSTPPPRAFNSSLNDLTAERRKAAESSVAP